MRDLCAGTAPGGLRGPSGGLLSRLRSAVPEGHLVARAEGWAAAGAGELGRKEGRVGVRRRDPGGQGLGTDGTRGAGGAARC